MHSPTQAILWKAWRLTRWDLLLRTAGHCGLYGGLLALMGLFGNVEEYAALPLMMLLALGASFSNLTFGAFDNPHDVGAFPFQYEFRQPVGTARLVTILFTYACAAGFLAYLVPAAFLYAAFDMPLPLWSAALVVGAGQAVCLAAVWAPRSVAGRVTAVALAGACAVGTLVHLILTGQLEAIAAHPRTRLPDLRPSGTGWTLLGLACIAAWAVTVSAVKRQRCGAALGWRSTLAALPGRKPRAQASFAGASRAQFWLEWRRAVLPVSVAVLLFQVADLFLFGIAVRFKDAPPAEILGVVAAEVLFLPSFAAVVAIEWASGLRRRGHETLLSPFEATQPVTTARLAAIKVGAVVAAGMMSGLAVSVPTALWLFLFASHVAWAPIPAGQETAASMLSFVQGLTFLDFAAAAVALPVLIAAAAGLLFGGFLLVGRLPHSHLPVLIAAVAYVVLWVMIDKLGWQLDLFWRLHAWAIAWAVVGATAWALARAIHRGLLDWRMLGASLVGWALLLAAFLATGLAGETLQLAVPLQALVAAALVLPLAGVALPPLAIDAYRHR